MKNKENIQPTGEMIGEFKEYTWTWTHKAKLSGMHLHPNKGVLAEEVIFKYPEAVMLCDDGCFIVDINKLTK